MARFASKDGLRDTHDKAIRSAHSPLGHAAQNAHQTRSATRIKTRSATRIKTRSAHTRTQGAKRALGRRKHSAEGAE